jgi:hypothetical protein
MISEVVTTACIEDVDFIQAEIERHCEARRTVEDFKAFYGDGPRGIAEAMASLKHEPSGRELPCGRQALVRFRTIAERTIGSLEDQAAWNPKVLAERLRNTYLIFMKEDRCSQSRDAISAWLEESVRHVQMRHRKLRHYIPCVALSLGDKATYKFGPITFIRKAAFFESAATWIAFYEHASERLSERARRNASPGLQHCWNEHVGRKKVGAIDAFRDFTDGMSWIAIIPVGRCEYSISEERAETALRIATSAIKLMLPGNEGADLRVADDPPPSMKKYRLSSINGKIFRTTGTVRFGSPRVLEEWEDHMQANAAPVLAVCHLLAQQALDGSSRSFGLQIALRAITWYADAVSDTNDETQIIKCAVAIETLVLPPEYATRASFIIRGSMLAQRDGLGIRECASFAKRLYKTRSDMAHGSVESLGPTNAGLSREALDFTRRVILQFLVACSQLKPLGSRREGTREDILEFYRQCQNLFSTDINAVVDLYRLGKSWKAMQAQV